MLFQETLGSITLGKSKCDEYIFEYSAGQNNYFQIASIFDVGSEPRTSLP